MTGANKSACAFALKLVNSNYTGAIVKIKRSSDNTEADFYTDAYGINFGTDYLGTGTSLTSWLNGATAFVLTWYNQVRIGQDATAGNSSALPILSNATIPVGVTVTNSAAPTGYYINFPQPTSNSTFCYFTLPDKILPYGSFLSSPYTYVVKTYLVPFATYGGNQNNLGLIGGGASGYFRGVRYTPKFKAYTQVMWSTGNDQSFDDGSTTSQAYLNLTNSASTNYLNEVATFTCSNIGTRNIYVNNILKDSNSITINSQNKSQDDTNNYIGYIAGWTNSSVTKDSHCIANIYSIYALPIDLTNNPADRIILEST